MLREELDISIINRFHITDSDLKDLQFYLNGALVLEPLSPLRDYEIINHGLKLYITTQGRVKFTDQLLGAAKDADYHETWFGLKREKQLYVSFGQTHEKLIFRETKAGKFQLVHNNGLVEFAGKTYRCIQGCNATLMVKIDRHYRHLKTRELPGAPL